MISPHDLEFSVMPLQEKIIPSNSLKIVHNFINSDYDFPWQPNPKDFYLIQCVIYF